MRLFRSLCLASLCCLASSGWAAPPRVFLGYYSAIGGLEVHKVPFGQLTHVSHAFLATDAEGKLLEEDRVPSQELADAAHKQGVKVLLSLGGGRTAEGLTQLSKQPEWLESYAKRAVELAIEHDYDGIDLVWEAPNDRQTRAGFVTLVTALRQELDARRQAAGRGERYLLTIGVPPSGQLGKWIDAGAVVGQVDWLNVMAFDMSGPWQRTAGHHAPLFPSPHDPEKGWRSISSAMDYWQNERGVPADKLVLGLAMYGRALPVKAVHEPLDPKKSEQHGALAFSRIRELIDQGWRAMWDKDSKSPWLQPQQQRADPIMICYDDRNSIHKKTEWAREQGFRGLAFWAIHQDRMPDGTHWLLSAAAKAWPK